MTKDEQITFLHKIVSDLVVANQSAWIEWQHGNGAEAAMAWVHSGLVGSGHIPNEDEPHGKDARAWYDAHKSNRFPDCYCGKPSHILWIGHGACCNEHMKLIQRRDKH